MFFIFPSLPLNVSMYTCRYEEAEEVDGEDEEGEDLGMNSPTRQGQSQPFGGHMASDASVLSGELGERFLAPSFSAIVT